MSHKTTIRLVKSLGKDFDSLVKKWRDSFIPSLSLVEVKRSDQPVEQLLHFHPCRKLSTLKVNYSSKTWMILTLMSLR